MMLLEFLCPASLAAIWMLAGIWLTWLAGIWLTWLMTTPLAPVWMLAGVWLMTWLAAIWMLARLMTGTLAVLETELGQTPASEERRR